MDPSSTYDMSYVNYQCCRVLFYSACNYGHINIIKRLLMDGDISLTNDLIRATASLENVKVTRYFLNDEYCQATVVNKLIGTPLAIAAYAGRAEVEKLL